MIEPWWRTPSRVHGLAAASVVLAMLGAWQVVERTGGTPNVWSHLMYVPVVLAAMVFGPVAAASCGVAGGYLLGPLTTSGAPGGSDGWEYRAIFFVGIGVLVGWGARLWARHLHRADSLLARLEDTYQRMLSTIASTVELRDASTAGHSQRVASNAQLLAAAAGHGDQEDLAYWAGLLHDLGKIGMPESVLQKQTRLDADEFRLMQRHPDIGADLLEAASPDFALVAGAVRSHHERWDGAGYPRQLAGLDIPVLGRIVAVVDVFEALTTRRPYHAAMSSDEAVAYLVGNAGAHFDPFLVERFVALVAEGRVQIGGDLTDLTVPVLPPVRWAMLHSLTG